MVLSLFFLTALIFTCSLIGYFDLVAACDGLALLLEQLSNDFYTLEKNAAELHSQRGRKDSIVKLQARYFGYRSYIYTANCSVLDEAGMQTFYEGAESLTFSVEGMGDSMNGFAEMLGSLTNFISMGQFGLVLAYWLLAGLGVFATQSKNCSCDDTLLLFSSSIILLCFIVYLGCMVALSVAAGDFCYGPDGDGPDASMTSAAENSLEGSQLSLTKHYMTCEGSNPLIECKPKIVLPVLPWTLSLIIIASHRFQTISLLVMSNMTTALVSLGNAAYSGRAANECDEDGIEPINGEITTTLEYFDEMIDIISCSTINAKIQKAVYVYVCDDLINGLWSTWALQSAASFLLWLSLVIFPFATNQSTDVLDITFGHVIWEDIEDETEKAEREAFEAAEKKRLDDAMRERQLAEAKRLKEKFDAEKAAAFDDIDDDIGEFAL